MPAPRPSVDRARRPAALRWSLFLLLGLSLVAAVAGVTVWPQVLPHVALPGEGVASTATSAPPLVIAVVTETLAPTPQATATNLPPTITPSPAATAVPAGSQAAAPPRHCALYSLVPQALLGYVDREVGLSRDYQPEDLAEVPLDPKNIAYRPVLLRQSVHQPLLDMVDAMNQAGLSVWVMSGFRSYSEQQLAYEKWQQLYPDRAPEISAVPGHSEHQLGTAVDITTPYMDDLYGDFFHVNFHKMPEGEWLMQHAAYYGFTLSYPAWAVEETGYAWEPWHFRYVGILAQELAARNITLTQYLRECAPPSATAGSSH